MYSAPSGRPPTAWTGASRSRSILARGAQDAAATLAEGRALWWLVDRSNLFVKIPATAQDVGAISASLAEGISVNVIIR